MVTAERMPANSPDGNMYLWGMCKGSWDDGTVPTCGHYLRWDLYKEAGYPKLENYDEDLLDVLEQMVALEPETADGQKTYGGVHGLVQVRDGVNGYLPLVLDHRKE